MSQSDFGTIDPNTKSGTALASDLNAFRDALHSLHSGPTAPSYATAGLIWMNSTSSDYVAYIVDAGNDSRKLFQIDDANGVVRSVLDADGDSWWSAPVDDKLRARVGGTDILDIVATGIQTLIAELDWLDSNGNVNARFSKVASAVNFPKFTNAATGTAVTIAPEGTDANIDLDLTAKGSGQVLLSGVAPMVPSTATRITANMGFTPVTDTSSSGAVTFDFTTGNICKITLTEAITSITLSGAAAGDTLKIEITQAAGGYAVSGWPASVKWPGGTAPTITATNGSVDIITLEFDGTNYRASAVQDYR